MYKYLLLQCKCFVTYVHILCICFQLSSMFFAQVKRLRLAKAQARAVISEMKKQSG